MAAKYATFSWRYLVLAALLIIYGYTLTQGQNVIIGTDIKEFECDFGNASQDLTGSVQIGQPEIAACNITGLPWRRSYTFFPNRFSLLDDETLLINGGGIATSKCHEKVMVPNVTDCPDALSAVLRSPEWKPLLCTAVRLTFWLRFSHPPNVTRDPATRYFLQVMLQYSDSTHRPTRQIWGTKTDYQNIADVTAWNEVVVDFDIGERFTLNYLAHHNQRICNLDQPWNISVDSISADTVGLGSSCFKDLRRQAIKHQPDFCKLDFYLEDENGVRPTDFVDQDLASCTKSVDPSQNCDYPDCFQWAPLHPNSVLKLNCDFDHDTQISTNGTLDACGSVDGLVWYRSHQSYPLRFEIMESPEKAISQFAESRCYHKYPSFTTFPQKMTAQLRSIPYHPSSCLILQTSFWYRLSSSPVLDVDVPDPEDEYFLELIVQSYKQNDPLPDSRIWASLADSSNTSGVWVQACVEYNVNEQFTLNFLAHHGSCAHNDSTIDLDDIRTVVAVETVCTTTSSVTITETVSNTDEPVTSRHTTTATEERSTTIPDGEHTSTAQPEPGTNTQLDISSSHSTSAMEESSSTPNELTTSTASIEPGTSTLSNIIASDSTIAAEGRSSTNAADEATTSTASTEPGTSTLADIALSDSTIAPEGSSSTTTADEVTTTTASTEPSTSTLADIGLSDSTVAPEGSSSTNAADEATTSTTSTEPSTSTLADISLSDSTIAPLESSSTNAADEATTSTTSTEPSTSTLADISLSDSTIAPLEGSSTNAADEATTSTTSTEPSTSTLADISLSDSTIAPLESSSTNAADEATTSTTSTEPSTSTLADISLSDSTIAPLESSSTNAADEATTSTTSTEPSTSTLADISLSDSTIAPLEGSSTNAADEATTSTTSTEPSTSTLADISLSDSTIAPLESSSTNAADEATTSTTSTEPSTSTLADISLSDSTIAPLESSSTNAADEATTSTTSTEPSTSTLADISLSDSTIAPLESSSTTAQEEVTTGTASTEPSTSTSSDITSSDSTIAPEESSSITTPGELTTSTASTEPGTSTPSAVSSSHSTGAIAESSFSSNEDTTSRASAEPGISTSSDITASDSTIALEERSSTTFPNEVATSTTSTAPDTSTPSDASSSEYITGTNESSGTSTVSTEPGTSATGEGQTTLLATSHTVGSTTNSILANNSFCDGDLSCELAWIALEPVTARKLACNFGSSQPSVTQGVYWCPGWERRAPWLRFQFDVTNHPSDRRNFFAISQCSHGSNAYFQNATAILRTPAVQPAECTTYNLTFRYQLSGPPSFSDSYYLDVRIGRPEETAVPSKVLWESFLDYEGGSLSGDRWNSASVVFSASESFSISFVAHHNDRCSPQNRQTVAIDDIATTQARKCTTTTQTVAVTPAMPLCSFPACFDWVPLEAPELLSLNCNFGHYQPAASQGVYWCRNWERKFSWLRYQFDIVRSDPDKTYAQSNCSVGTWSAHSFPAKAVLRTPAVFTRECTSYRTTFRYRLASAPVFNEGEMRNYYLDLRIGIKDEHRIPNRIIWSTPSDFSLFNAVDQWTNAVAVFDVAGNESFHINFVAHHGSQCSSNQQAISIDDIVTRKVKERTCASSTVTPAIHVTTETVQTGPGYDDTTEATLVTATQSSKITAAFSTESGMAFETMSSIVTVDSVTDHTSESPETTVSVAVLNADTTAMLVIPATTPSVCPLQTCTETIALPATLATKLNCNFGSYQPPGVEGVYWCPKWERKYKWLRYQFDIVQQGSQNAQAVSQCSVAALTTNTNSYKAILRTPMVQAPECTVFFLTFWYMMSGIPNENFYLDVRMGDANETQVPSRIIWEMDYGAFRPNERISASVRYEVPQHQAFVISFVAHHHSRCATAKETIVMDDIRTQQVVSKKNCGE